MTLDAKLHKKLSDWQPAYGRRQLTINDDSGWNISFTLERRDELSCLLWDLSVTRTRPTTATLQAWAARIAKNLSAVLGPVAVLEVDEQRQEGMLRSTEPHRSSDALLHYEVFLAGVKSATLRRCKAPADRSGKREQTAFALTNESLAKLMKALINDE